MIGRARLVAEDRGRRIEVLVSWQAGYDLDAVAVVPEDYRSLWAHAAARIDAGDRERPYPSLPISVPRGRAARSATGIYATARELFGSSARWLEPPPYPSFPKPPEGAVP